jgi:hypothetical protein
MAAARAVGTNNKLMVAATSERNRQEIEQSTNLLLSWQSNWSCITSKV